jgi:ribosomal protein S18 acetylase RimI-like enzyme
MVREQAVRRSVPTGELPDFTPVPRKNPRHDGWTPERQRAFIEALADTGCVAVAARMVNMSKESAYQLRRQPGAESFRRAWDAAQILGLQPVRDEAFDRAMNGQLVPVFVGGKLMGFRRKKNDALLMYLLSRHCQEGRDRKTTINYFSTRASAGAGAANLPLPLRGEGRGEGAAAEASTTTVKTVISGSGANGRNQLAADESAANVLNAFEGVELDEKAQAEIYRTLEACAERRRALENDPENDPDCLFASPSQAHGGAYLGELEIGAERDWVEYKPEGEHSWENLGEGGQAAEIDKVLAGMAERRAAMTPEQIAAEEAEHKAEVQRMGEERTKRLAPPAAEPDPDDPRLDWRNWSDDGYVAPSSTPAHPEALLSDVEGRTPKPAFTPPGEARKAEAAAAVKEERRVGAADQAERRRKRKGEAEG